MGLIALIVVGLIAGLVASWLMKARTGILVDLILGIVGAVVGGWITSLFTGVNLVSGKNTFVSRVDPRSNLRVGQQAEVAFDMDSFHIFDAATEEAVISMASGIQAANA